MYKTYILTACFNYTQIYLYLFCNFKLIILPINPLYLHKRLPHYVKFNKISHLCDNLMLNKMKYTLTWALLV